MNIEPLDLIKFESAKICTAPGVYEEFPVVDGKGLFCNFRKTDEKFEFKLEEALTEPLPVFAIYKKSGFTSVLVCAFSTKEELNEEAKAIIHSTTTLRNHFETIMGRLK